MVTAYAQFFDGLPVRLDFHFRKRIQHSLIGIQVTHNPIAGEPEPAGPKRWPADRRDAPADGGHLECEATLAADSSYFFRPLRARPGNTI
jgi:hypothetical protein